MDILELRVLRRGGYPGLHGWGTQCNHKGLYETEAGVRVREGMREGERVGEVMAAGFEDGGRSHEPRNVCNP